MPSGNYYMHIQYHNKLFFYKYILTEWVDFFLILAHKLINDISFLGMSQYSLQLLLWHPANLTEIQGDKGGHRFCILV